MRGHRTYFHDRFSYILLAVMLTLFASLFLAPAFSISSNPCSSCHGNAYNQQIDFVETAAQNNVPSSIQVGQTLTVTVVLQNINNSPKYTQLSNVAATLSSQNNHFSVSNPTYNIGSLPTGTATASWQITGTSAGTDQLIITVSAVNTHKNVYFTDSYSPNPSITVTQSTSPTQPTPTDNPTVTPTPTPTAPPNSNPTVQPTSNPSQTVTPHPTNTATSTPTATSQPTEPPTQTPAPTASPSNGNSTNHLSELNSNMLYIHPPLSIASYVFIFLLTGLIVKQGNKVGKWTKILGLSAWVLTVLGLVTGMIWAQIAWGSYWSWDLKEILTLALFLTLTVAQIAYFHGKQNISKWLLITASALVVVNILSTFIVSGLHSFA